MTTLQMLSFFIMPVGAFVIAGLGFLWVRTWDKHEPKPGEERDAFPPRLAEGGQPKAGRWVRSGSAIGRKVDDNFSILPYNTARMADQSTCCPENLCVYWILPTSDVDSKCQDHYRVVIAANGNFGRPQIVPQ